MDGRIVSLVVSVLLLGFCHGSRFSDYNPITGGLNAMLRPKTAPKPCCVPKQFETYIVGLMAEDGKPKKTAPEYLFFSYDALGQRTAFNGAMYTQEGVEPIHFIQLFAEKKMYFIKKDGSCVVKRLEATFGEFCVRKNYNYITRVAFGGENDILLGDTFFSQRGNYQETMTFTTDGNCFLITESSWGNPNANREYVPMVGYITFVNTTIDIKSYDVFTPPKVCKAGDIEIGGVMKYYLNKFRMQ